MQQTQITEFSRTSNTAICASASLQDFAKSAGLSSLIFISFPAFKRAVLGPKATASYYLNAEIA